MEHLNDSPVNNSLMCTYLCTYCEIWIANASTYFCIFVLPFQNNIKFNICHNVSSFVFNWFSLCSLLFLFNSPQHIVYYNTYNNNTGSDLQLCLTCYNIWIFPNCVTVLIIASFSQMRSYLHPKGNWTALLMLEFRVVGQALSLCVQWLDLLSCACSGWVASPTGPMWEAAENQIQAGQLFSPVSSGISLALGLGGWVRGMEGEGAEEWMFRSAEAWVLTHFLV